MRKSLSVALVTALLALPGVVGMAKDAQAAVTITLSWGACGGGGGGCTAVGTADGSTLVDTLSVSEDGGQTLRLDIFLSTDEPLLGHSISLSFDTDLLNELSLTSPPLQWTGTDVHPGPGTAFYRPDAWPSTDVHSTVESTGLTGGRINSFDSFARGGPVMGILPVNDSAYSVGSYTETAPAYYRIGRAFFTARPFGLTNDGADVFSGLFATGFDTILASDGSPVTQMTFLNAWVNVGIPEPGTVSLLGLGLAGLVLAARLGRRA